MTDNGYLPSNILTNYNPKLEMKNEYANYHLSNDYGTERYFETKRTGEYDNYCREDIQAVKHNRFINDYSFEHRALKQQLRNHPTYCPIATTTKSRSYEDETSGTKQRMLQQRTNPPIIPNLRSVPLQPKKHNRLYLNKTNDKYARKQRRQKLLLAKKMDRIAESISSSSSGVSEYQHQAGDTGGCPCGKPTCSFRVVNSHSNFSIASIDVKSVLAINDMFSRSRCLKNDGDTQQMGMSKSSTPAAKPQTFHPRLDINYASGDDGQVDTPIASSVYDHIDVELDESEDDEHTVTSASPSRTPVNSQAFPSEDTIVDEEEKPDYFKGNAKLEVGEMPHMAGGDQITMPPLMDQDMGRAVNLVPQIPEQSVVCCKVCKRVQEKPIMPNVLVEVKDKEMAKQSPPSYSEDDLEVEEAIEIENFDHKQRTMIEPGIPESDYLTLPDTYLNNEVNITTSVSEIKVLDLKHALSTIHEENSTISTSTTAERTYSLENLTQFDKYEQLINRRSSSRCSSTSSDTTTASSSVEYPRCPINYLRCYGAYVRTFGHMINQKVDQTEKQQPPEQTTAVKPDVEDTADPVDILNSSTRSSQRSDLRTPASTLYDSRIPIPTPRTRTPVNEIRTGSKMYNTSQSQTSSRTETSQMQDLELISTIYDELTPVIASRRSRTTDQISESQTNVSTPKEESQKTQYTNSHHDEYSVDNDKYSHKISSSSTSMLKEKTPPSTVYDSLTPKIERFNSEPDERTAMERLHEYPDSDSDSESIKCSYSNVSNKTIDHIDELPVDNEPVTKQDDDDDAYQTNEFPSFHIESTQVRVPWSTRSERNAETGTDLSDFGDWQNFDVAKKTENDDLPATKLPFHSDSFNQILVQPRNNTKLQPWMPNNENLTPKGLKQIAINYMPDAEINEIVLGGDVNESMTSRNNRSTTNSVYTMKETEGTNTTTSTKPRKIKSNETVSVMSDGTLDSLIQRTDCPFTKEEEEKNKLRLKKQSSKIPTICYNNNNNNKNSRTKSSPVGINQCNVDNEAKQITSKSRYHKQQNKLPPVIRKRGKSCIPIAKRQL